MLQPVAPDSHQIGGEGSRLHGRPPADLAADLRRAHHARGLSLGAAAEAIGIDKGYLSRLERGLRAPRMAVAGRWAAVLGVEGEVEERLRRRAAKARPPSREPSA